MSFINNITNGLVCQGWVNPSDNFYGPRITTLSSYYSPAGSSTIVSIIGTNFYSYSTIMFGTYAPTVYFISSLQMDFYIPNTITAGTYPVQVFNGSFASNIVNYTLDNASGYWLINPNNSIYNKEEIIINLYCEFDIIIDIAFVYFFNIHKIRININDIVKANIYIIIKIHFKDFTIFFIYIIYVKRYINYLLNIFLF